MSTRLSALERTHKAAQKHLQQMQELLRQAQDRAESAIRIERTARKDLIEARFAWGLDEYGNDPAAAPNDVQAG